MHRVLIIEDDDIVKNMLKQIFQRAGYETGLASNGRIGLELYENNPYDVVVTDLIMPEMEGIETITKLRKKHPKAKIIAISGGGRNKPEEYLLLASKLGADYTFEKPLDRKKLLQATQTLIDASG